MDPAAVALGRTGGKALLTILTQMRRTEIARLAGQDGGRERRKETCHKHEAHSPWPVHLARYMFTIRSNFSAAGLASRQFSLTFNVYHYTL